MCFKHIHISVLKIKASARRHVLEKQCKLRNAYNLKIAVKRKALVKVRFTKTTTAGERV